MMDVNSRFDAFVVASAAGSLGLLYVVGGVFALLAEDATTPLLLAGSVPVSLIVGTVLVTASTLLVARLGIGRYLGILGLGAVVVLGRPSLAAPETIPVIQTILAVVLTVYLLFRNPVPTTSERSNVDEETSASKVGSTIR